MKILTASGMCRSGQSTSGSCTGGGMGNSSIGIPIERLVSHERQHEMGQGVCMCVRVRMHVRVKHEL